MRRKISAKLKNKVALEAIGEKETLRELSQKHSVQASQIQQWKKVLVEGSICLFDKNGKQQKDQLALMDELYRQIGQLKVENEYVKKEL